MDQHQKNEAVFNQFSSSYDDWFDNPKGTFIDRIETELAFKLLQIKKGMKILDIGCGTGHFSINLAQMGCLVTGIDVSDEMLKIARFNSRQQGLSIDFVQMDVQELSFNNETFDAAVSMAAFEFIRNSQTAFAEMSRVVRTSGQILIGTIARDSAWGELYSSEEFQSQTVFKHAHFKTKEELSHWDPSRLIAIESCLFIDPQADVSEFNHERERELAHSRKGGFICALWKK